MLKTNTLTKTTLICFNKTTKAWSKMSDFGPLCCSLVHCSVFWFLHILDG